MDATATQTMPTEEEVNAYAAKMVEEQLGWQAEHPDLYPPSQGLREPDAPLKMRLTDEPTEEFVRNGLADHGRDFLYLTVEEPEDLHCGIAGPKEMGWEAVVTAATIKAMRLAHDRAAEATK